MKYTPQERINAFWNKVNKDGSTPAHCPELGQCWEWIAYCNNKGYGVQLWYEGNKKAHCISWVLVNGNIPNGLWVLHKCDNPACVRPDHLFLGTAQDNVDDRERKRRGNHLSGENNNNCKLTDAQVEEIRSQYATLKQTYQSLASQFGVSRSHIGKLITRRHIKR